MDYFPFKYHYQNSIKVYQNDSDRLCDVWSFEDIRQSDFHANTLNASNC